MILKVDNEELDLFIKTMREDSDNLSKEIDKMISLMNRLNDEVWQGIDAKTFNENVTTYLEKMKVIPKALSTLSNISDKLNKGYAENDEAFAKALEEVANKYAK